MTLLDTSWGEKDVLRETLPDKVIVTAITDYIAARHGEVRL